MKEPVKFRALVAVRSVTKVSHNQETLKMSPVVPADALPFGKDGESEENTYAKWTPSGEIRLEITNPNLHDKLEVGDEFYVDFTPREKP